MLLLDENQEVLTLVTNSLKKYVCFCHKLSSFIDMTDSDLNHPNQYIVGLALCTLGNIASVEMARDLFPEVETIIASSNPYIRRKAALCAMRICRKVPDLQEHFVDKAKQLLQDRNHGVLLCGLNLVISMAEADEAEDDENGIKDIFRPMVPSLVKILKGLSTSGYAPEHDVQGITDPFLQVKILNLLRVLARGDVEISEQINDILAQVRRNLVAKKVPADHSRLRPTPNLRKTWATLSCTRQYLRSSILKPTLASVCSVSTFSESFFPTETTIFDTLL